MDLKKTTYEGLSMIYETRHFFSQNHLYLGRKWYKYQMRKKFVNRQGIYSKFTKMVTEKWVHVYDTSIKGY